MRKSRILSTLIWSSSLLTPMLSAGDLSRYRDFQFGMSPSAVLKQAGINPPETKVVHKAPALIEEIEWNPQRYSGPSSEADSVKEIQFRFYNGELFQMAVTYDRYRTEGLTADDFTEAFSVSTNTAPVHPSTEIVFPSTYSQKMKVIARWEDSKYSFNLVRVEYQQTFAMVLFAKQTEALARAAAIQAVKLEEQEAPQREIEFQRKQELEKRTQQEKARLHNKPGFRP